MSDREALDPSSVRWPLAFIFLGAVAVGFGMYASPERAWMNLLLDGFYLLSLAVSAMFFLASQLVTGARWSASIRRVSEALALLLLPAAAVMLALFLGRSLLYPEAPDAEARAAYLRGPFVFARLVVMLVLWTAFMLRLRSVSLAQDGDPGSSLVQHRKLVHWAAGFLVVFAPTFTLASYDWLLALEPRWFSTMFAIYAFAGTLVQGISAVTLIVVLLKERGFWGSMVEKAQLHDLGKLLFAFSTFWAYIWVCQYLLVWYGNLPDEVTYYVRRTNGPWLALFAFNVVVNWLFPFLALMSARAKKDPRTLVVVSSVLLFGRWLDLYVMIMPSKWQVPRVGLLEVMTPVAIGSLAYLVVLRGLFQAPLVPLHDPILAADRDESAGPAREVPT